MSNHLSIRPLISLLCVSINLATFAERPPNIVYILADDLGWGDLSLYGQQHFQTPNIDRIAKEGIQFTQHYSGSTVCAPSRSCLMTGLHTGNTPIRGNFEILPEGQMAMPAESVTIAEILKREGYVTGAFGKWGLGFPGSEGDPTNQGFDVFFGYNCQRKAHNYYPYHLWSNRDKVELEGNEGTGEGVYAPDLIQEKTLEFIEQYKNQSFFCFVPHVIPHAELFTPERYMARFRGRLLPEKSYEGTDAGPNFRNGPYGSQPESHAAFAAMVTMLDDHVGQILDKLAALKIDQNTLVIFTSDNGAHREGGADPEYFDSNGPFRGLKRDLYEGGIRVPMLARWTGRIAPNSESDHISAFWDVFPTFCEIAGIPIPDGLDGISFAPTLLRSGSQRLHEHLFWGFYERGGRVAVRKGKWKLVKYDIDRSSQGPWELYDLSNDIGETENLAPRRPEIVELLARIARESNTPSPVEKFRFKNEIN
ncbi:MAG: arylsulfatase [Verrucomicrobiota bacterium]|nr:arylsulfatase [Verrucomicrobiota bacterium]